MIILSKIFGNSSFNSAINLIRQKNSNFKLFKSKLYGNSKLFVIFLVSAVLATAMLTTNAWAYKVGDFPGVGSYDKWQEARVYYSKAVPLNNLPEEEALNKKAIDIYPYEACFWLNYAYSTNNKEERIRRFLEAARLNPDDCRGYQDAGVEYQKLGQYEKAIECYEQAIKIKPFELTFYGGVFNCLISLKKYKEAAIFSFKSYKALNNTDFLYNIGYAYEKAKEYKLALKYYEEYLKLNPTDKDTLNSISLIKKKLVMK